MKIQVVIAFAVLSFIVAEDVAQVYCGRRLAQTIGYICTRELLVKRSGYPGLEFEGGMESWQGGLGPWVTPARAQGLRGGRGKREAIVDECCLKPCTIDELLAYC